jgi:ABC-type phosphate transport system substrate-binding protein
MKSPIRSLLAVLAFALSTSLASAATFVTNPSGPDSLDRNDVKNILLGNKTKWDAGGLIKLAVLTEGATHDAVLQEFTARSADQFDKYWKKQVFTGKGVSPDAFKTDADLVAFVAKTPGAFGYISDGPTPAGVKVVTIK